jgi:MOSC domain-containing protein YiiM
LGENLTTTGIDRKHVRIGQQFRVGDAVIEITKLREPCKTIAVYGQGIEQATFDTLAKAGDPTSPKWGLAGFYASVVRAGRVSAGCPISLLGQAV